MTDPVKTRRQIWHPQAAPSERLPEIDRLRGLVMVLMALDHVRDFFDADAMRFSPTDLDRTYLLLFLTRIVTHFCAPTFTLLAGASAWLYGRGRSPRDLCFFLATRGLWLILLDIFVVSPVWALQIGKFYLGTLWAIGFGLVCLAALSRFSPRIVMIVGLSIVFGHNLLDGVHAKDIGDWGALWSMLHEGGALPFGFAGRVVYPGLPWVGIIAVGYGLGPLFAEASATRDRALRVAGLGAVALFLALRAMNLYGDPHPWSVQSDLVRTGMSFLNLSKYPPSLLYALATLGPACCLLPVMRNLGGAFGATLIVFGRAPMFFYILHLYVALGGAFLLACASGWSLAEIAGFAANRAPPENFGIGLSGAYCVWVLLVMALYPLCSWFAAVKQRRSDWWLSYL